jgi:hypothetical protein
LSASRPGRALPPEKGPLVPIVQEARWASEPVWTHGLEEKSLLAGVRSYICLEVTASLSVGDTDTLLKLETRNLDSIVPISS